MPSPREATSSAAARAKCRSNRTRNAPDGSGARRRCTDIGTTPAAGSRRRGEAIRAPVLASHTVVHEEQTFRIVLCLDGPQARVVLAPERLPPLCVEIVALRDVGAGARGDAAQLDRKSTRLNSSHLVISYAVFCLKKKRNLTCLVVASIG